MTFAETLAQVVELLRSEKRVTYRALKRRFNIDDAYLADLAAELIEAKHLAIDENGAVLVWVGDASAGSTPPPASQIARDSGGAAPGRTGRRLDAELRQLTVMFCDIVNSTALSTAMEPEDLRQLIRAYQQYCAAFVHQFDGHVGQYLGDGILAYFGYPAAHEDDSQRAVRAAVSIVGGIAGFNRGVGRQLQVRIGIHTGPAIVGEMGTAERPERMALGETLNLAARLQEKAAPDTVVISPSTYRLVSRAFLCRSLGPQTLKGLKGELPIWQVLGEESASNRFELGVDSTMTPLVGRNVELGILRERWAEAATGNGQVVLISGEAGIGKSRLLREMTQQAADQGWIQLSFRCLPYYQNTAFFPVAQSLERVMQLRREDSVETKLEKLEKYLGDFRKIQPGDFPLLAALLSLPHPAAYPALALTPQRQKQSTQQALQALLLEHAERLPVLLIVEDLHWADASTLELITMVIEQVASARLLMLLTFRPDFTAPWTLRSHVSQIALNRLSAGLAETMVKHLEAKEPLPRDLVQQIVAKTDGVPLFVEELTKSVLDSVKKLGRSPASLVVPATLNDSLMARLDRLGDAKEVAQLASAMGREFTFELIQAVSGIEPDRLAQSLSRLVAAEVVHQRGTPPQARYIFKHALLRDAAYLSLLKSRRQQYHKEIALVLRERFPETADRQPELLAHHYTGASLSAEAIPLWQKAGQRAVERSANLEAIAHLSQGLELVAALPETPEKVQQELELRLALGVPLVATRGFAAPEVENAYARAREICQQVDQTPQLFPVLWGLWLFYLARGEHQTARGFADQCLKLAQIVKDPAMLVEGYHALGTSLLNLAEPAQGLEMLKRAVALYDETDHRHLAFQHGQDPAVVCLSHSAWALWFLGYPEQALKKNDEALALARRVNHAYSLNAALNFSAWLYQLLRQAPQCLEQAELAIALATEQGFPYWWAMGNILKGWALAELGQADQGVEKLVEGVTLHLQSGAGIILPYYLVLLAGSYAKTDRIEEARQALTEAEAAMDKSGERWWEPELIRLEGELTLREQGTEAREPSQLRAAENCFRRAMAVAKKQDARFLELRAAMSLSVLELGEQERVEARRTLADLCDTFTEGFDTPDLVDARALLERLSRK